MEDQAQGNNKQKAPVTDQSGATKRPGDWKAWTVAVAGIGAPIWGLVSGLGNAWGMWSFKTGLTGLQWSFFLAIGAILFSLLYGWRERKSGVKGNRLLRWTGFAIALLYAGYLTNFVITAKSLPAIHDISTDLADPPQFTQLVLRTDNLDNVPGNDDPTMKAMTPQQRWILLHQKAYGDIRSVRINKPVVTVMDKAQRLAKARGWEIAVADAVSGHMEATVTSRFFGFKDDIVLRVRAAESGNGSIVDMRSVSRVGQSDLGVNAKRVRKFLSDLSGTVSTN